MSQKPLIFISHITEESELAKMLAAFIKKTYLNMFDVFVSSDGENISSGDRWLESIDNALGSCVIQVSLCSPYSVTRPWINFEAGASWIRRIPVIPICHSGMTKNKLPLPLSLLQGIDMEQSDAMDRFFVTLSDKLGADIPSVDASSLINDYKDWSLNYTFTSIVKSHINNLCSLYPVFSQAFYGGNQSIPIQVRDQDLAEVGKSLDYLVDQDLIGYSFHGMSIGGGVFKTGSMNLTDKYMRVVFPLINQ